MLSQRQIRDHIFLTVTEAEASGRPHEICFVSETLTGYEFVEFGSSLLINGHSVLASSYGANSRWRAIYGKYEMGKYAVPVVGYAQYTVFVDQELPELVFDTTGNLVMQLVDGGL
jgi:hypothetical protein